MKIIKDCISVKNGIFYVTITLFILLFLWIMVPLGYWIVGPYIEDMNQKSPITDKFLFYEKDYSKEYNLRTLLWGTYEIAMESQKPNFPLDYKFNAKIAVEMYCNNRLAERHVSSSEERSYSAGSDTNQIESIVFQVIEIPINYRFNQDLKLKITVLKPDKSLENYQNLKVVISRRLK